MATPPISNVSIFQEIQSFYQNRGTDIRQLGSALQSGNLNAAQQAYDTLASLGQGGPFANSEPFVRADRAKDFEAIGQAIKSGDVAGAQAAFADLQHSFRSQSQPILGLNSPADVVTLNGGAQSAGAQATDTESIYQQLQQFRTAREGDVEQLGKALQSGDLQAAQQAYDTLVALGKNGPFGNSQPFQRLDRAQDFTAIGKALQSGDLAGAQQAFAALAGTFGQPDNHGGPVPPVFINVYLGGNPGPIGPPTPGPQPVGPPSVQPPATEPPAPQPVEPPSVQPPATEPPAPQPVGPPIVQPPATEPPSTISEIVINIGGSSSPTPPSGQGSELVLNLPSASGPNATAEEVQINFGGSNGSSSQLTIDVSPIQSKQGSSGEQISINFGAWAANAAVVLNLFDTGTGSSSLSGAQSQSNSLNIQG